MAPPFAIPEARMFPQSLVLDHPTGNLHALHWANPGAPPLVLSHGTGFCAATWTPVAERLAGRFDVYAIDRRGHGGTDLGPVDVPLWAFGDDLAPLLARRPDAPWHGVGHSAGSTDLLFAAAAAPDRFIALALHEPTVAGPPEAPEPQDIWAQLAEKRRGRFADAADVEASLRGKPVYAAWTDAAFAGYQRAGFRDTGAGLVLRCPPEQEAALCRTVIRAMHNAPDVVAAFGDRLAGYRVPTHLLRSEDSPPIFAVMVERLRRLIDALPPTVLAGGHCAPMERPEAFAEAVLREMAAA